MADTSDNDGRENQGPDPLSYASATDFHQNNSPSHSNSSHYQQHPEDPHHQQPDWTHDDHSNNNNSNNDSSGSITTDNSSVVAVDNGHRTGRTMDNSSVGFEDGGTPPPYSMETSGHVRLGREGSADGGSTVPLPGDDDDDIYRNQPDNANRSSSSKHSKDANNSSSAESTPRRSVSSSRAKSANPPTSGRGGGGDRMATSADMSMLDMKTSWDGSATGGGAIKAGMLADPAKIAKEREREERVRQARERLEGERKKKLDELREQQRLAQENRERQLEMRRQKIEDLRKRDTERRAAVEERRRMKEEIERLRKESILQKAEERVARYEAWRAGGRKGGRGQVLAFGSSAPRDVCFPFGRPRRSSSHSALNSRHSPNGSDMDAMRPQRRALSACSAVRRHCCVVDANQMGNLPGFEGGTPRHLSVSTSVLYSKRHSDFSSSSHLSHANRPESTMALDTIREGRRSFVGRGGPNSSPLASMSSSFHAGYSSATPGGLQPSPVRMRERSSPRKPRPASVGTSMPSFVGVEPAKLMSSASRSKSSDRMARDRSKRPSRRKDKVVSKDSPASAKTKDKKEAEDEKDGGSGTTKKGRVSLSFFDRLSTPKFQRHQDEPKNTSAKKESPIVRVENYEEDSDDDKRNDDEIDAYMADPSGSLFKLSPRKAYSTTNLACIKKKTSFREKTTKAESGTSTTPRHMTPRRDHSASSPRTTGGSRASPAPGIMSKSASAAISPRVTPPPSSSTSSSPHPTPSISVTSHHGNATPTPSSEDGTATPRSAPAGGTNQDISKEAYKAKMAEKRRQAREKAEKEAEEERKRQEEERLAEEEKMRQEEEEQCRLEEETIRLAEEARKAEGERLQRAIEAEEKRKKEEAERLEQEKKAKEEADRKAKEEAERIEREKQERAKKEEEERQQRKKKLEMIMKRVKTEPAADKVESPVKSSGSSPNRSALASPEVQELPPFTQDNENSSGSEDGKQNDVPAQGVSENVENSVISSSKSPEPAVLTPVVRSASSGDILDSAAEEDKKEMEKGDSLGTLNTPVKSSTNGTTSEPSSTEVKSRFKSPLLQQLVENKGNSDSPSGSPKFKSPLLQNLLGKTKVGARMGLSASMGDLNLNKDNNSSTATKESSSTNQQQQDSVSPLSLSPSGSSKEISKAGQDEDKDVDESVGSSASSTSGNDQESFKPHSSSSNEEDHLTNGKSPSASDGDDHDGGRYDDAAVMTKSSPEFSPMGMIDSALGSSIEPQQGDAVEFSTPSSVMSNGHGAKNLMEDSSISVQTPEEDQTTVSAPTATSFNQFNYQSGQSSQDETEEEDEDEERGQGRGSGHFEELIDLPYTSSTNPSKTAVSPIIAFEENSLRTADVGESMS